MIKFTIPFTDTQDVKSARKTASSFRFMGGVISDFRLQTSDFRLHPLVDTTETVS